MTLDFFNTKKDTLNTKSQSVLELPFAAIELTDEELALVDGGHGDNCDNCNNDSWGGGGHHHGGHFHGGHHHGWHHRGWHHRGWHHRGWHHRRF